MKKLTDLTEDSFSGQKVLVFGFGVNGGGLGTVEFLLTTQAAEIVISDKKTEKELASTKDKLPADTRLKWHLGEHDEEDFRQADIVIKNPGIRWDNQYIKIAEESGAIVLMDSTIFMALCKVPVIGITGSKGKTTTASLVAHILEQANHHVVRVGISQIGVLSELAKVKENSVVVFELSSWRLAGLRSIEKSPEIAIITNLYPDHLNYYEDMEEYADDKAQIFSFQNNDGISIFDGENKWTEWFVERASGKTLCFGKSREADARQDESNLFLKTNGHEEVILEKEKVFFSGDYIFANFLAASLAARVYGVDVETIRESLMSFQGVPHRFELVRNIDGVNYINDTAATIPEASLASVKAVKNAVILLAGGSDKGLPLEPLVEAIKKAQFTLLFTGTGTDKIVGLLEADRYQDYQEVESMEEALKEARIRAQDDMTVLLAPGAASFGMFQNEFDRGEQFRAGVLAVSKD